ncbi:hypothetical protein FE633_13280 [Streptomyces montanus]|uniref:DNA polymerase III beta sliding clamp central domain-containing protein n=1 Tax=Streptomyces montanus TaxID=2580423 RepID=A0A5R9FYZ3_9ACTN|nr:hypothetical protein [Streptomyces montanus]TLS45734.1 hypothetical protein FE633_13280 [Streptomyces montanus]
MAPTAMLNAHHLARLIRSTAPHTAIDGIGLDRIDGIRFDSDGTHLHAIATDGYTLAAARSRLAEPGEPFARTVHGKDLATLRAWVDAHVDAPPNYGQATLTLTTAPGRLVLDGPRGTFRVPVTDDEKFPDWRQLLSTALADLPANTPCSAWSSELWERWQHAGRDVRTWHAAPEKSLIVVGTDIIGLQKPHRLQNPSIDRADTPAAALDDWAASLGSDTGEPTELADAVPEPDRPTHIAARTIPEMTEDLLRQTLNATSGPFRAPSDPEAREAFRLSGTHAWVAYRYLKALRLTDPDLAAEITAELSEELDSGEIGEWVWDAAIEAGHDPQKWADENAQAQTEIAGKTDATATDG